jgi:hypothetical protein
MGGAQFHFSDGIPGGTFTYPRSANWAVTDVAKSLRLVGSVKAKAYTGFGIFTTACTDASSYAGISFRISGNVGPSGMLNFRVATNRNTAIDTANKKGTCVVPAGETDSYETCHPSESSVAVSATENTRVVLFSELSGGKPFAQTDGHDIVGLEWAFAWVEAESLAYDFDVTIDDIMFVK